MDDGPPPRCGGERRRWREQPPMAGALGSRPRWAHDIFSLRWPTRPDS